MLASIVVHHISSSFQNEYSFVVHIIKNNTVRFLILT